MLVWLVGAHDMLNGQPLWPSELQADAYPAIKWEWSHCLDPELTLKDESGLPPIQSFVPEPSRQIALEVVRSHFTEDVFLAWLESIGNIPYLESELAEIPASFERLYVRRSVT